MRRRLGPPGLLAGIAGSLLVAIGALLLTALPGAGASGLDVYAGFLDHRDEIRAGAAATIIGLALLIPFLTSIRIGELTGPRRPATTAMLVCGALAVAAGIAAAAIVGALAAGAENADPASSRTLLDVAGGLCAAAGPLLALALIAAADAAGAAGAPAWVPRLWSVAALGCLLWLGPLVSDAAIVAYGSLLGTFAGIAGLVAWTGSAALLARRPDPRVAVSPQYVSSNS